LVLLREVGSRVGCCLLGIVHELRLKDAIHGRPRS
jgi:hypothetical protein